MGSSCNFSLLLCSVGYLMSCGSALAQQVEANSVALSTKPRATTSNIGVTPPMGPPEDPFGDQGTRGTVVGGLRVTPAISLTTLSETNPTLSSPKGPTTSGAAADLALRVTPLAPNGTSAFIAVGATRLASLDNERDRRLVGQFQGELPVAGWMLPLNLMYSRNNLARGSLVSEESKNTVPLAERQVAVTTIGSVDAVRTFGLNTITLGLQLIDTAIGDARTTSGDVQKSTASNLAQNWSAKLTRPLTPESQWYVRGGYERYKYDNGNEPVIGTRDSVSKALALGTQGMHGKLQGMAEFGYQIKQSHSLVVPDSQSIIGAVMAGYAVSPALRLNARVNRSVVETNLPGVSNILATSTGIGVDWRFAPKWIVQVDASMTDMSPHPLQGLLKDQAGNITLLWKPQPRVLLALTTARSRRSVSEELAGLVNGYTDTKTTLNLTYYY